MLLLLKLGDSVITYRRGNKLHENIEAISRISKEIAQAYTEGNFKLIIVHGMGSYAHEYIKKTGLDKGLVSKKQLSAIGEIQRLQNVLNAVITKQLINNGIGAMPCQASSFALMDRSRLVKFDSDAIAGMIGIGLVPVLYGGLAYDRSKGCSVLSGDKIIAWLGSKLCADKVIHGTDVDGIYTADPKRHRHAKLIREVTRKNLEQVKLALCSSAVTSIMGGLWNKVMEIAAMGIETQIVNARIPNNIYRAMCGEKIGTTIMI